MAQYIYGRSIDMLDKFSLFNLNVFHHFLTSDISFQLLQSSMSCGSCKTEVQNAHVDTHEKDAITLALRNA